MVLKIGICYVFSVMDDDSMKIKQEILDDKRTVTKDATVKTELLDDFMDGFDDEDDDDDEEDQFNEAYDHSG